MKQFGIVAVAVGLVLAAPLAHAVPINSLVSVLGGPAIDFEGRLEGALISNQYAGVTFGQVDGGTPMIDNSPFLFGYVAKSGSGVLTGSQTGGAPFPTVAGLKVMLNSLGTGIEFFLSDTAPLGDYTVSAYGGGGGLLESFVITLGGPIGSYVGFQRAGGDLSYVTVDSNVINDAFAIDDVRVASSVPEPGSVVLLGLGLASVGLMRRRRS